MQQSAMRNAPPAATEQPYETVREHSHTVAHVLGSALACVFGGLGAGMVVAIALAWLGASPSWYGLAGLSAWGVVAGALLFWSFARDPIRNAMDWERLRYEADALDDDVEALADELAAAKLRADNWESEARRLQMQLTARRTVRTLRLQRRASTVAGLIACM